jgi:hypothetical protein
LTFFDIFDISQVSESEIRYLLNVPHFGSFTSTISSLGATANWINMVLGHDLANVRVLQGPTNEAWIDPWVQCTFYRNAKISHPDMTDEFAVGFHLNSEAVSINMQNGLISSVTIATPNGTQIIEADYFIFSIPNDKMDSLLTEAITEAAPSLSQIDELVNSW